MRGVVRYDVSSDDEVRATTGFAVRSWKKPVAVVSALCGLAAVVALTMPQLHRSCPNLHDLEGKSEFNVDEAVRATARKLTAVKDQEEADKLIMKTMVKAGHDAADQWEQRRVRKLDTLATIAAIKKFRNGEKTRIAGNAECAFNIMEAFISVVAMGDDINGIVRTCPPPRDGESELACQVDSSILVTWVGNTAAKLSLAASNCALKLNVDAICSAGVTGLVSVMGEIAAGASLGAAVCAPTPPALTTTQISVLGDQTVRTRRLNQTIDHQGRRLLIGQGPVGNGVQCGVDVGMVAANIANMGIAINKAVNVNKCKASTFRTPLNVLKGIPEAVCTVDIGGAIAYIGQVVVFINLIIVHCQDFLNVNALCAGSIAAITTGAAAIAPYGAAVHAGCANGHLLKTPKAVAKISALWNNPTLPLSRRLDEEEPTPPLAESLAKIAQTRELVADLNIDTSNRGESQANMETLLNLMSGGLEKEAPRAAWPFQEC